MDFLKSCTTNVRVVEQFLGTPWSKHRLDEGGEPPELLSPLTALRARNILCAAVSRDLWVFGELDERIDELLETYGHLLHKVDSSIDSEDPETKAAEGRMIQHVLLNAVEGSISFALAQEKGMLHLASWSWVFSHADNETENGSSTLVRLHPMLTENGALYISITTRSFALRPMRKIVSCGDVILAPSGRAATLEIHPAERNAEAGQSEKSIVGSETWKQKIADNLAAEGIRIDSDDEWTTVELLENGESHLVLWPVRLCLKKQAHTDANDRVDWKYWFPTVTSNESHETYRNPLAEAEEWATIASDHANHSDAIPDSVGYAMETTMITESPLATSPPFNQRTVEHQAAISGIYPTPPDGLVPAHGNPYSNLQHSYTSEGGPAEYAAQIDQTQFLASDDTHQDHLRQSLASSTEGQSYQANALAVDDLFGDIGEMGDEFGANEEVGDADFDYFDEPDENGPSHPVNESRGLEQDIELVEDARAAEESPAQGEDDLPPVSDSTAEDLPTTDRSGHSERLPDQIDYTNDNGKSDMSIQSEVHDAIREEPEKPLSPFGIRERLLPPPIPASVGASNQQQNNHLLRPLRRSSTFDPVSFNEGLDLSAKYGMNSRYVDTRDFTNRVMEASKPNIMLPSKWKKPRIQQHSSKLSAPPGVPDPMDTTSSEEDSYDDMTSLSEGEEDILPPRLPWDTKKRKRDSFDLESSAPATGVWTHELDGVQEESEATKTRLCDVLASSEDSGGSLHSLTCGFPLAYNMETLDVRCDSHGLPAIEEFHHLTKLDLVYVAQIISEQAVTATMKLVTLLQDVVQPPRQEPCSSTASTLQALVTDSIDRVLSGASDCSLARLALTKEPPPRTPTTLGKPSQTPHPRSLIREGSMQLGPDYFAIPLPYVHVQRGTETWEMLSPALSFWSALGLGPASGAKDIRVVSIVPESEDLKGAMKQWMVELGRMYEGYKLGSFDGAGLGMQEIVNEIDGFEDGVVELRLDNTLALEVSTVLKEYTFLCSRLGKALAKIGHVDPNRTFVICMVNPFEKQAASIQQHLCACFWFLYKAYRDNSPKAQRNVPRSDIVLQILPISLIASSNRMVMLDSNMFGTLATEIYDRCPPSAKAAFDTSSSLSILAAPAVELASLPPKRLVFQLATEPPGDLLHEGSILHLAYAVSGDGNWMTAFWLDSTGRYQSTMSASLRGKSFKDVASEIWERTMEIIAAREVMWRVFIAASVDTEIDRSVMKCWRYVVATKPRRQMLHVTLLSVDPCSPLQLKPPAESDGGSKLAHIVTTPGGGFLTPASTPQGPTFTVSPDASGQSNAPPTPAPSDATPSVVDNDPDAHLLDLTDESWGMLLAPPFLYCTSASGSDGINVASGLLFRRGDGVDVPLETLRIDLHWDIRLRPNGLVDDGPPRQVEANLRDVLRMYRNLSLLGKAKGINGKRSNETSCLNTAVRAELMPMHIASAVNGAAALNGLLGGGT